MSRRYGTCPPQATACNFSRASIQAARFRSTREWSPDEKIKRQLHTEYNTKIEGKLRQQLDALLPGVRKSESQVFTRYRSNGLSGVIELKNGAHDREHSPYTYQSSPTGLTSIHPKDNFRSDQKSGQQPGTRRGCFREHSPRRMLSRCYICTRSLFRIQRSPHTIWKTQ